VRKPSVCKVGEEQPSIEELEKDEYLIAVAVWESQQRRIAAGAGAVDDPADPVPVCLFEAELGDQETFPALAGMETKPVPQLLHGAWAAEPEKDGEYLPRSQQECAVLEFVTKMTPAELIPEQYLPRSQQEFAVLEFVTKVTPAELTPEQLPRNVAKVAEDEIESTRKQEPEHNEERTPEKCPQPAPQEQEVVDELHEDWIVVASDDASKAAASLGQVARTSFDAQHPRNVFGKKAVSKHTMSAADSHETGSDIDWSASGMPTDLLRRFIRGSINASRHGVQSENKMAPTASHIMRAQNLGSSKRERSQPSTPRSHSKPRVVRQTSRGR
jgi:hypothetical protein